MFFHHASGPKQFLVARLAEAEPVAFGPLAQYRKLLGEDGGPIFTGVQSCAPGYRTPDHFHPYVECLFVIEGKLEAWLQGHEAAPLVLEAGDMVEIPAEAVHAFRNPGPDPLRLLGIHNNPERVVHVVHASDHPAI